MIREKDPDKKPVLDLSGPDGNAFALMGYARRYAKELDIDPKPIIEDMMSSDYEHLLEVFDTTFGEYVILER